MTIAARVSTIDYCPGSGSDLALNGTLNTRPSYILATRRCAAGEVPAAMSAGVCAIQFIEQLADSGVILLQHIRV